MFCVWLVHQIYSYVQMDVLFAIEMGASKTEKSKSQDPCSIDLPAIAEQLGARGMQTLYCQRWLSVNATTARSTLRTLFDCLAVILCSTNTNCSQHDIPDVKTETGKKWIL